MPAKLRPAVIAIYRFARYADDIADEGNANREERLLALTILRDEIAGAREGRTPQSPYLTALLPYVAEFELSWEPFEALLSAFTQDVTVNRYANEYELDDYCRRSANPVGHLILALQGQLDEINRVLSDHICTALQQINFLQDAAIDWKRGRLYLPLDALVTHGVSLQDFDCALQLGRASRPVRTCIASQAQRANRHLQAGSPLPARVGGRLGWELRAIISGGQRILNKLAACEHDPFQSRPKLGWRDAPALCSNILRQAANRSLRTGSPQQTATR